jgi:predicted metal-binding membrane protein
MRGMGGMSGTAGLDLAGFVPLWTAMMTAMMLPSVTPLASMYAMSVRAHRPARLASMVVGYLGVWAAAGLPIFALASGTGRLVSGHPTAAHAVAVVVFASCGVYQLTSLKQRCLARCRSPIAQLLRYGSFRGWSRDLRAGAHHGATCLACCWALMTLLVAFGVMSVLAALGLAVVVLIEKTWRYGAIAAKASGVAALALAVTVVWVPGLAPALHGMPMSTM